MTYQETLDYLYNKLPMFSRMGSAALKKDLTNTLIICERLGNPQTKFKSIHIAGTNGKGSVSHMMAAALQASGYKTGLYTSPHLYDFRERIKLNGQLMDEEFVVQFVQKVQPLIDEVQPSFFEITVAMAFEYFALHQVDVAVIEVGLGGRLDSTNIILPELSIITNIGFDHQNILGNSLEEIAAEKGGIIKENTPVVIGQTQIETEVIFRKMATEKNATIFFAEDNFQVEDYQLTLSHLQLYIVNKTTNNRTSYSLDLPGFYQTKNIAGLLQAIEVLKERGWKLPEEKVKQALQDVKQSTGLYGRWEVISEQPTIVLEVAHNEDGVKAMLQHVQQLSYRQLHIVLGLVKDKEMDNVLQLMPADAAYHFTQAHIPRALPASMLQQSAAACGLTGRVHEDVNTALTYAKAEAGANDLIIVCGSIFLVAEVRRRET